MNLLLTLTLHLSQFPSLNPPAFTASKVPAKPTEGVKATKKRVCWSEAVTPLLGMTEVRTDEGIVSKLAKLSEGVKAMKKSFVGMKR